MPSARVQTVDGDIPSEFGEAEEPLRTPAIEKDIDDTSDCDDGVGIDAEMDVVKIPSEVSQALLSWDRVLYNIARQSLALQFTRAATEVLRLASPQKTPDQWQLLVDNLHSMGKRHGLSDEVLQSLMAAANVGLPDYRPCEEPSVLALKSGDSLTTANEPRDCGSILRTWEAADVPTMALDLTYFDECSAYANKQWILKGLIALGETSAWIAPPGAGKSALLTEIAVHCAARTDWRGYRAKAGCGVVVLALERGNLFKRRLYAYHRRDKLAGLPIAVADAIIDLLDPSCVEIIVSTVKAAEEQFGREVGLIILDTYAKGIAANGGDEDKARDQNRAAANLRNVHARLNVHIALVGHTGKNEDRGARGSNAHVGDVDVMVQISGDVIKTAEVIKGNDQPERAVAHFKLEAFELGHDDDSDPITTAIVTSEELDATQPRKASKPKLTPNQKTLLEQLNRIGESGLLTEDWNKMARAVGIGCHRRADLTEIRNALQNKGLVRVIGDRWTVQPCVREYVRSDGPLKGGPNRTEHRTSQTRTRTEHEPNNRTS